MEKMKKKLQKPAKPTPKNRSRSKSTPAKSKIIKSEDEGVASPPPFKKSRLEDGGYSSSEEVKAFRKRLSKAELDLSATREELKAVEKRASAFEVKLAGVESKLEGKEEQLSF